MTLVPSCAPLVVLALLGSAALVVLLVLAAAVLLVLRRPAWAVRLSVGAAGVAAAYAAALGVAALAGPERTLPRGGWKVFCEIDCHLAYRVDDVFAAPGTGETTVVVRTLFDPKSIAPWRGDAPLTPNPRVAWLVDGTGRRFPLDRPLRPGESYATHLVFAPSREAKGLRLFLGTDGVPDALLLGHENAPGHGRVYFSLEPDRPSPPPA